MLQVQATGVEIGHRGFIRTDEYLETGVSWIWALGDIVSEYLLKHSANRETAYVANNMFNPNDKVPVDYHAIHHAIFSSPQVAGVGVTEEPPQEQELDYTSATYGSSIDDRDGLVKVLAHLHTREILGCHIIGSETSILMQEAINAMRARLSVDFLTQSIYVHPALPEVVQRA